METRGKVALIAIIAVAALVSGVYLVYGTDEDFIQQQLSIDKPVPIKQETQAEPDERFPQGWKGRTPPELSQ